MGQYKKESFLKKLGVQIERIIFNRDKNKIYVCKPKSENN